MFIDNNLLTNINYYCLTINYIDVTHVDKLKKVCYFHEYMERTNST